MLVMGDFLWLVSVTKPLTLYIYIVVQVSRAMYASRNGYMSQLSLSNYVLVSHTSYQILTWVVTPGLTGSTRSVAI